MLNVAPLSDGMVSGTWGFSGKDESSWSSVLLGLGEVAYLKKRYREKKERRKEGKKERLYTVQQW